MALLHASAKLPKCRPSNDPNVAPPFGSCSAVNTIPTIGSSANSENAPRIV